MSTEVKVPMLPESVADATVINWRKKAGDTVKRDETIVELETDKVVLEVPAPEDGTLVEIKQVDGAIVTANTVLAIIGAGAGAAAPQKSAESQKSAAIPLKTVAAKTTAPETSTTETSIPEKTHEASPSVRRLSAEHDVNLQQVKGSGKGGKVIKEDVLAVIHKTQEATPKRVEPASEIVTSLPGERLEKRVPMSRLRAKIAERLLQAQHNAAMLTTFNEINLQAVINLRTQYKDLFEKKYQVKLGFMSFFTKAVVEALKRFPAVNASIDGSDVVYHGYFDIGIAVSTERGLVVPVVRDADQLSMAQLELTIADFAAKARNNKLTLEDMQGGTFTITNGGIFGSLMATPILNPPQAGILGMHKIQERPVVENDQIVIRPMMYVALSYDHRLIDGKESVQFLVTVKEMLEDPQRLLLEV